MFQFPRSASSSPMDSVKSDCALPQPGSPIRTSPDQCLLTAPRGIFVVRHVLLRLLAPRHPPCALTSLTMLSFSSKTKKQLIDTLGKNVSYAFVASLSSFQGTSCFCDLSRSFVAVASRATKNIISRFANKVNPCSTDSFEMDKIRSERGVFD